MDFFHPTSSYLESMKCSLQKNSAEWEKRNGPPSMRGKREMYDTKTLLRAYSCRNSQKRHIRGGIEMKLTNWHFTQLNRDNPEYVHGPEEKDFKVTFKVRSTLYPQEDPSVPEDHFGGLDPFAFIICFEEFYSVFRSQAFCAFYQKIDERCSDWIKEKMITVLKSVQNKTRSLMAPTDDNLLLGNQNTIYHRLLREQEYEDDEGIETDEDEDEPRGESGEDESGQKCQKRKKNPMHVDSDESEAKEEKIFDFGGARRDIEKIGKEKVGEKAEEKKVKAAFAAAAKE